MTEEHNILARIRKGASELGSCGMSAAFTSVERAARLLFLPQSLEFVTERNYPTIQQWREIQASVADMRDYGIFVDAGEIYIKGRQHIALIGDTKATVQYEGCEYRNTLLLLHGASARVKASRYAVVNVERSSGCSVTTEPDKTSMVL